MPARREDRQEQSVRLEIDLDLPTTLKDGGLTCKLRSRGNGRSRTTRWCKRTRAPDGSRRARWKTRPSWPLEPPGEQMSWLRGMKNRRFIYENVRMSATGKSVLHVLYQTACLEVRRIGIATVSHKAWAFTKTFSQLAEPLRSPKEAARRSFADTGSECEKRTGVPGRSGTAESPEWSAETSRSRRCRSAGFLGA
jgi:hypothetical protein